MYNSKLRINALKISMVYLRLLNYILPEPTHFMDKYKLLGMSYVNSG